MELPALANIRVKRWKQRRRGFGRYEYLRAVGHELEIEKPTPRWCGPVPGAVREACAHFWRTGFYSRRTCMRDIWRQLWRARTMNYFEYSYGQLRSGS